MLGFGTPNAELKPVPIEGLYEREETVVVDVVVVEEIEEGMLLAC